MAEDIGAMVHQTLLGDAWDNAHVAVAVFSDDGRYLACNAAFCELTGYSRDEVVKMRVGVDLAGDPSTNQRLFEEIVEERRVVGSGPLQRKDGSVITVNVWAIETRVSNLPYFVVLYWDAANRPKRNEL